MLRNTCVTAVALFICLSGCKRDETGQAASGKPDRPRHAAKDGRQQATEKRTSERQSSQSKRESNSLDTLGYIDTAQEEVDPNEGHGVVLLDEKRSHPGYNLYCSVPDNLAELIDAQGTVVHSWTHQPSNKWERCELLPNGDLLVIGIGGGAGTGKRSSGRSYVLRMSWDGDVLWQHPYSAHHDLEVTPRNQILVLTGKGRRVQEINPDRDIRDHLLTLLSHKGTLVEEYSIYDLFNSSPSIFSFQEVQDRKRQKDVKAIDLLHINSAEWMHHPHLEAKDAIYASTNVIVCSRKQDTIAIINWDEKKLVWAWGQGEVSGQHEASVLKNGNILIFDNGNARSWSRVIELNPLTREIVWEYKAANPKDFFCALRGVSQRLPNGNTLICDSSRGEAFEVTRDGEEVWRFLNPHVNKKRRRGTIRLKRYELSYVQRILESFSGEKS